MLHGLGDGPSAWSGLAEHLRARGDFLLTPDLARLVDADRPTPTIELMATAVATAALASRPPGASWFLAGHSMGGLVAIALAERLEGVRGLALIEGSIRPGDAEVVRPYAASPPEGDGYGRLLTELTSAPSRSVIDESYLANLTRTPPTLFRALAGELVARQAEFAARFQRLALPRLYLASTESRAACSSPPETLVATGAEIMTLGGTNHWLHAERPRETADVLLQWSARILRAESRD